MILLKALHLAIRVAVVLICAYWVLIMVELLPPFFSSGLGGVRGKLVYIWSLGKIDVAWDCQDSMRLLHEGYTDLLLFLLLTWGLVELKRFLERKIAAGSLAKPESTQQQPEYP